WFATRPNDQDAPRLFRFFARWNVTDSLRAVQRVEVQWRPFSCQQGQHAQDRRNLIGPGYARRAGTVGTLAEIRSDHARAGSTGADFHEEANAIAVSRLDHSRKIDGPQRLGQDSIGSTLRRHVVSAAKTTGIKAHVGRRSRRQKMQSTVGMG